jgi:Subtilisin inhibitor-like
MSVLAAVLVAATSLHVTVWPDGPAKEKHTYTLRCAPTAGTLPKRAAACAKLARMSRPFAPTPKNTVCTQLYGGPAEAVITGRLRGYPVSARFSRRDGCEVARWNRVGFLFPGVGTSQSGS